VEVKLVSFRVHRPRAGQARALFWGENGADLAGNRLGHLALQGHNVAEIALVVPGPQVLVKRRIDQLAGDPHPVTGAKYRALHNAFHS
jgi:hypothetical protein